ncbi:TIGR02302 family protein [Rhodobacteraceae bacterium]|nr:TIGR02302 family protein [Paracoccaceae bacterium]
MKQRKITKSADKASSPARIGRGAFGDRALERRIRLTRTGMVIERGLQSFWPALSLLAVGLAGLVSGVAAILPPSVLYTIAVMFTLAMLIMLGLGARRFRWPGQQAAIARLDATLAGRPLAALRDQMALGAEDPQSRALWQAHIAQMSARARRARVVRPNPDLARHDPYALRLTALTTFIVALVFGAPSRLLSPGDLPGPSGSAIAAMGPSWEGWAEPPRYTSKPGLYLNNLQADTLRVPEGTRFSFRFYGERGAPEFTETVSNPAAADAAPQTDQSDIATREFEAVQSGLVTVSGTGGRTFSIEIAPDASPTVALVAQAERRADGKLSQPFHAEDDYAITGGRARVTLDLAAVDRRYGLTRAPEPRDDLVFDLPLPFTGTRANFDETLIEDAAKHPWANLPVKLELEVEDGRGQTGTSAAHTMELPGRRFFDPRAASLIEIRRDLLWNRENAGRSAEVLRAITYRSDDMFDGAELRLLLRAVIFRLEGAPLGDQDVDQLAEVLWELAVKLEDGGLANALAAMQQAQERLSEAMRNGASKDEIDKLMAELKEATQTYMRMLAERAKEEETGPKFGQDQPSQQITGDQLGQMMDEIQRLMEQGRMAEAQELLDQLSRMMENMKVTQGEGGQGDQPGGESMQDLRDTLREQQDLSDEAFRDLQRDQPGARGDQGLGGETPQGQTGDGQSGEGDTGTGDQAQKGEAGSGVEGLAERQRALRQELGRQKGLLPQFGSEQDKAARQRLDDAGRAMEEAERALRKGDTGRALDRQAEAIQNLREGMQSLSEAMNGEAARRQGQEGGNGQERGGDPGADGSSQANRDPLGRSAGEGSRMGTEQEMLQGKDNYGRARDLLDEIRRRSAERQRPAPERDYLDRLLENF